MINSVRTLVCSLAFCVGVSCGPKGKKEDTVRPALRVKQNTLCNEGMVCARAEFSLSESLKDAKLPERMDKELPGCFYMLQGKDTTAPIAVERVNQGVADQLMYVIYFEKQGTGPNRIYYNDRFFGWKQLSFDIE